MKRVLLVRTGEINLKGLNRSQFEDKLAKNIRKTIAPLGNARVVKSQSRIYIVPEEAAQKAYDFEECAQKVSQIFGVVSVSIALQISSDFETIRRTTLDKTRELLSSKGFTTFKVESRRGDKKFPLSSIELSSEIGHAILTEFPDLKVDIRNPQFKIYIEVRESTYVYTDITPALGGMPLGTNGKALLLLSGGIDSPVAGFMTAKRGVWIDAVHFFSFPYTSERAKEKVLELAGKLAHFTGNMNLYMVPFTKIQEEIRDKCPEEYLTIVMRRFMMRIAEKTAQKSGALALVTGESIGQVASQTLHSMHVTNHVVQMPVLRPLIGMDKNETIDIARKIGTYETSILPYEDCCTVFLPRHPQTKPDLHKTSSIESVLDIEGLVADALENTRSFMVYGNHR